MIRLEIEASGCGERRTRSVRLTSAAWRAWNSASSSKAATRIALLELEFADEVIGGAISISIDGLEQTHDAQRGVKGSWRAAVSIVTPSSPGTRSTERLTFSPGALPSTAV